MYRQMSRQMPLPEIYCIRQEWCDLSCGKFHHYNQKMLLQQQQQQRHVRNIVDVLEGVSIEANAKNGGEPLTTILPSKLRECRPKLAVKTQPTANDVSTTTTENVGPATNQNGTNNENANGNGNTIITTTLSLEQPTPPIVNGTSVVGGGGASSALSLSLTLPPVSPQPAASPASQASTVATSVTLDDIIASARRKISEEYQEIRLPSPVFLDGEDTTLWDKKAAKKRLLFHESSLDIPAMEQEGADGVVKVDPLHQFEDQDSEAELVIQEEPPSFIDEDETADFEEMIKATKPPSDAYSNPILLRDSDPLTTRKKPHHHQSRNNNRKMLPRQQSISRIHQLDGGGGSTLSLSQRSTPSGARTEPEDTADNSSIDLSMTKLSTAVAGSSGGGGRDGKSPPHSGVSSPSNILQFIEEQKQRAAATEMAVVAGGVDDGNGDE